ncbi:MAG: adenylate/guanylate cyclase domain-containing protein [Alphaproteobacteria bacterium]|nr:adenylate/guanylate cyclase domain-containing protein [Alphaproteobacteria bacterium]
MDHFRQGDDWDGQPASQLTETDFDVLKWGRIGRRQTVISTRCRRRPKPEEMVGTPMVLKSLLFADVKGSSKIEEDAIPIFVDRVLGGFAKSIAPFEDKVAYRETAGDGLYIAFTDIAAAAECGLELIKSMQRIDFHGLPPLALRVSAHVGAVYSMRDPVTGYQKFFGGDIVRAARIEPITPPGYVYVTEEFAAQLYLEASERFNCDYVGCLDSAKGYGSFRMYSLRHRYKGE